MGFSRVLISPILIILNILSFIENKIFRYTNLDGELGLFAFIRDLLITLTTDILDFMGELYNKYPGTTRPIVAYLGGGPGILFRDPKHINAIFESKTLKDLDELESAPRAIERFRKALGLNLITVDINNWSKMRTRTMKLLSGKYLDHYETIMRQTMETELVENWTKYAKSGLSLDIWSNILSLGISISFKSFMGLCNEDLSSGTHLLLNDVFTMVREVIYSIGATTSNKYIKKREELVTFIDKFIPNGKNSKTMFGQIIRTHTERKEISVEELQNWLQNKGIIATQDAKDFYSNNKNEDIYYLVSNILSRLPIEKTDLLQTEMESFLCKDGSLNKKLIFEETISNLIGGSETTIIFMAMSCYYLSINPDKQEKLRYYLQTTKDTINEQINNGYLGWVINETLRLNPPGALTNRQIKKPLDIGDFIIDPKFLPWMSGFFVHKDPLIWENPEQFIPERWEKKSIPGSYFPFGSGPRICVGMNFAKREGAVALSCALLHFRISLTDPNFKLVREGNLTLRPRDPIMINVRLL